MARRTSLRALSSAVLFALLVTAVYPQPAYADEGAPPPIPEDPIEASSSPDPLGSEVTDETLPDMTVPEAGQEGSDPAEPIAGSPTSATEDAPLLPADNPVGAPVPDETVAAPSPSEEDGRLADLAPDGAETVAADAVELLTDIPEGTTVAVLDPEGAAVPLVSDEAQAIIASGDPVWCPASYEAPTPGVGECSPSQTSMADLIGWLDLHEQGTDGIIWIEGGVDPSAGPLAFNDSTFPFMSLYKLTLRGGWDGVYGSKAIDPLYPSIFSVSIEITDWHSDVTISGIAVRSRSGGDALVVEMATGSPGNITLSGAEVTSNAAVGARLDNSAGTGKVSVADSYFQDNPGIGLRIDSAGAVTLNHIIVHANTGNGAYINATYGTGSVTVARQSIFEENGGVGLMVEANGAITAADLIASYNGNSGAALLNDRGTAAAGSPGIKLTGSSEFTGNGFTGLVLGSFGPITLSNIHANGNVGDSGVTVTNGSAVAPRPVTLTGTNTMKYNGQDGIGINSDGKVSLNNLTANGNGRHGLNVYTSDIALTGLNTFNDNFGDGVYIEATGAITAANVAAERNDGYGASLHTLTAKPITFTGVNTFRDNYDGGLWIDAWGAVTLSNVTASGNTHGDGAEIINTASGTAQKVTLSGTNVFDGNYYGGLLVASLGAISVSNLRASGNGTSGAGDGASLTNIFAGTPQSVTLTGSSLTSGNRNVGLSIGTKGNITAANVTASGNASGNGAYLRNDTGTGNTTLTGSNLFNGNYGRGLEIWSAGVVKISNLTASRNTHNQGALIVNATAGPTSPPRDVILSGIHAFDGNYAGGLEVRSYGAITLSSATGSGNGTGGTGTGITLDNDDGTVAKTVTLSGTYDVSGNRSNGLVLGSMGPVKVNNLTAIGNTIAGADISLNDAPGPTAITLSGASVFSSNGQVGLDVRGRGPITLNSVTASGNGTSGAGRGLYVENPGASTPQPIKLTGTNAFCDNHDSGLEIMAYGAISVANVTASDNGGSGAYLVNTVGTPDGSSPGITLTGVSTFDGNDLYGLRVETFGAVSLNSVSGRYNGEAGLSVNNASAAVPKAVKLTGTNAFLGNGVVIGSLGAISANNLSVVNAPGDTGYGTRLNNLAGTAGVTLTGVNVFSGSTGTGLGILTHGPVNLTRITADDNAQNGISISGPASSITLTCGVATNNGMYGMQAATGGLLKLIGWFSLGVNGDDLTYGDMQVTRACPLP